jgi:hypothetical protein
MASEWHRVLVDAQNLVTAVGGPAVLIGLVRWFGVRRGERSVLGLQTNDDPLDVVITTSGYSPSAVGPTGFARYTTGFGQVIGLATIATRLRSSYRGKRLRVQFSERVSDAPHDLVILGGLDGNDYAIRLVAEMKRVFGDQVFHYNDRGSTDLVVGGLRCTPFDLRITEGIVRQDLGIVIFWRNFLIEDWRRALLCFGFTTYGTAEAVRFAFDIVTPSGIRSVLRPSAPMRLIRKHLRNKTTCVVCVALATFGTDQEPEAPPRLIAAYALQPNRVLELYLRRLPDDDKAAPAIGG